MSTAENEIDEEKKQNGDAPRDGKRKREGGGERGQGKDGEGRQWRKKDGGGDSSSAPSPKQ